MIRSTNKFSGLAVALWFLLLGITFFNLPQYFQAPSSANIFNILGWVAITISIVGAFIELGHIFKSGSFAYFGSGFAFLLPAVLLHFSQKNSDWDETSIMLVKILAVLLFLIGSGLFSSGLANLFESREGTPLNKFTFGDIAKTLIAMLTLLTAILQLTKEILSLQ